MMKLVDIELGESYRVRIGIYDRIVRIDTRESSGVWSGTVKETGGTVFLTLMDIGDRINQVSSASRPIALDYKRRSAGERDEEE